MSNRLTQFQVEQSVLKRHGLNIVLMSQYEGLRVKIEYFCLECLTDYSTNLANLLNGPGCFKCADSYHHNRNENKRLGLDAYNAGLKASGFNIVAENYINSYTAINHKCLDCSREWVSHPKHVCLWGCKVCRRAERAAIQEKVWDAKLKEIHGGMFTRLTPYVQSGKMISVRCEKCTHVWDVRPIQLTKTNPNGCPKCAMAYFSRVAVEWLDKRAIADGCIIQHADNVGEFRIPGTRYRVDGYCAETNTVYEFHGDVFHGNPDLFAADHKCHPFKKQTAGELYAYTLKKEEAVRAAGFNLVARWENDYRCGVV